MIVCTVEMLGRHNYLSIHEDYIGLPFGSASPKRTTSGRTTPSQFVLSQCGTPSSDVGWNI